MVDDSVEVSDYRALRNCKNQFNPSQNDLLRKIMEFKSMRNAKGGHLFRLSLILVGLLGLSLMTDMPVPTENADAWAKHECCVEEVQVWVPYETTTWGAIKSEDESGGFWTTQCAKSETFWHWKAWPHDDPC